MKAEANDAWLGEVIEVVKGLVAAEAIRTQLAGIATALVCGRQWIQPGCCYHVDKCKKDGFTSYRKLLAIYYLPSD